MCIRDRFLIAAVGQIAVNGSVPSFAVDVFQDAARFPGVGFFTGKIGDAVSYTNLDEVQDGGRDEDVDDGQFKEDHPAELHHLVVTEAGERPAHPDEEEIGRASCRERVYVLV